MLLLLRPTAHWITMTYFSVLCSRVSILFLGQQQVHLLYQQGQDWLLCVLHAGWPDSRGEVGAATRDMDPRNFEARYAALVTYAGDRVHGYKIESGLYANYGKQFQAFRRIA